MKRLLAAGTLAVLVGCMNPETPMNPAAETINPDVQNRVSPTTPTQGTIDPSHNSLNHQGTSVQNSGSSSPSGATGDTSP